MALTKKQEQELRAAQAEEQRIAKLKQQLEEAEAKKAERAAKHRDDIIAAIQRKKVSRQAQTDLIVKANGAVDQIDKDIATLEATLESFNTSEDGED